MVKNQNIWHVFTKFIAQKASFFRNCFVCLRTSQEYLFYLSAFFDHPRHFHSEILPPSPLPRVHVSDEPGELKRQKLSLLAMINCKCDRK